MSALSFKINAETDKLNSFIASLKRLKEVLADIPSGTKEFDVINRKIAEMEARVEQTMKRIAQMQNEAAKTVSQPTAASPAAPSSAGSASGAQAVNAETEAWRDLLEELKTASDAKSKAMIELRQYQNEVSRLKAVVAALNKEELQNGQLSSKKRGQLLSASTSIEEYKQQISRLRRELANQIKLEQAATGSMDEMSQALSRMRIVYRSLNKEERESTLGQNLLKNIQTLDTKIKELDASIGNHQRNVGNYASSWNGLSFSIQQVARELPSLAVSPQTFFLAISNNLPILADQLALTKQRVQELKNAGQSFTPVWKQVLSSIISWQTALVAGITVLTLYGKEIAEWVGSLFKGEKAVDAARVAAEQFHATMAEGSIAAQSEITKLNLLYKAATDLSKPYQERAEAVKKLQDIYPAYFGNMSAEQVMIGNAVDGYNVLRDAILETAKARAAENQIIKNSEPLTLLESTGDAYKEYIQVQDDIIEQRKRIENAGGLKGNRVSFDAIVEATGLRTLELKLEKAETNLREAILKLPGGEDLWNKVKKEYQGNIKSFVDTINETNAQIAIEAQKLYTGQTPDDLNKKAAEERKAAEEARRKAEQDAQKAASEQEKTLNDLEKALQKLRDDALQAEIDSMQEGTAKKVAQINLDYQRRAEAINNAEQQIIKLQGELTREQADQLAAVRNANESQRNKEFGEATLPHIDIDNLFASERQSWNEYMIQYGNFRERLQATKDEYDRKIAEAGTEGERKVLEAEKQRTLAELEVEGSTWAQELSSLTVKALEELISETQKKLEAARKAYDDLSVSDSEEGTKLRGEIVKLDAELKKLKSVSKDAGKSVNDGNWSNAATAFEAIASGARSAVENIRDFDEGLAEALNTLINVSTNAAQFANSVDKIGEQGASFGNIMGSVSAGIGLISSIVGLFGQGETSMERNLRLAKEFNEELRIMNERARINSDAFSTIFGTNEWGNYLSNLEAMNDALDKYNGTLEGVKNRGKEVFVELGTGNTGLANLNKIDKEWEDAADSVANMQVQTRHSTWFRSARYKSLKDLLPELFEGNELNMEALKEFVDSNDKNFQHLSKENQAMLKEMTENWETYQQAVEAVNDYLSGIFQNLGDTLTDALISSFETGTDAAEAFGDAAGDVLKQLAKDMLYSATIGPAIEKAQRKIEEINENTDLSEEDRYDAIAGVTEDLLDDVLAQQKVGKELWERLKQAAEEKGIEWSEENAPTQSGTARGYQVASQDEVAEQNGRLTDIQGKLSDIRAYVMDETISIISLISSVATIQVAVVQNVQINNELLQYAVRTYIEVAEINASTRAINRTLTDIKEDITAIKRKTMDL